MNTTPIDPKRIYGKRPEGKVWENRIDRSKIDRTKLIPALEIIKSRNYYIRVWAYPRGNAPVWDRDPQNPSKVIQVQVPHFSSYRYRRDGKIEQSWVTLPENNFIFENL